MFLKVRFEQIQYGINLAEKIRLGPDQLPHIYNHIQKICDCFGIGVPEVYLEQNLELNAYAFGETRPSVTIQSGLVAALDEDELVAVLAHECGHIVCHHNLYRTMADYLASAGSGFLGPLASLATAPVQIALQYWIRRSELSADRAAAVFLRGPDAVVKTMIRLAGGPKAITEKVDVDVYLKQADDYDKLQEATWDKLLQTCAISKSDHPFLAVRAREILKWCQTDQFRRLVQALEENELSPKCPVCGRTLHGHWKFCSSCGAPNPNLNEQKQPTIAI